MRRRAEADADAAFRVRVAGRVVARRQMGKVIFLDLLDDGARLQAFLRRSTVGEDAWTTLALLDLGDFLGVEGDISAPAPAN